MPCTVCRQIGHNIRTCSRKMMSKPLPIQTETTRKKIKRSGRQCLKNGVNYERHITRILSCLIYKNKYSVIVDTRTGGATKRPDIQYTIGDKRVVLEVKNKNSFEGGGQVMKVRNGILTLPCGSLHSQCLPEGYTPWGGKIPSFHSVEKWQKEKKMFKDEYLPVENDMVSEYYRKKGVDYIQIEGKGLYHTGTDILQFGVPSFECPTRLRIRCKQHSSSPLPGSIQSSFVFRGSKIIPSPYDLSNKLPVSLENKEK